MLPNLVLAGIAVAGRRLGGAGVGRNDGTNCCKRWSAGCGSCALSAAAATGAAASQLCVGDPRMLAQIQHGTTSCTHLIVDSTANSVTISYSCKGAGQGLTTIRKESGRLVQIKSQGIRNNSPFSFSVEGRRSGGC